MGLFGEQVGIRVPAISGLVYCGDLLGESEQAELLAFVDRQPWLDSLKRRTQHYGYPYNYTARTIDRSMRLGDLPREFLGVAERLVGRGLYPRTPDQVIVNEYLPGQGISAHVDCEPCFADAIATVSLGWAYPMDFIRRSDAGDVRTVVLEPGSALVFSGEARYEWKHRIRARQSDGGVRRRRRVSLTFRNVILAGARG
jgi:alkylated DNA repair dioxygenase AlkB